MTQQENVCIDISNNEAVICVSGAVDNQRVVTEIIALLEQNKDAFNSILLDLSDVLFINTFFVNGLIRIKRQFGAQVSLTGVNPSIREILDICNVSRIIAIR